MKDPFKKLWNNCASNAVRQDEDGNWTLINSSTNKRRMEGKASSVGGVSGPNQKQWIPSKLLITPDDLKMVWEKQNGKCYYFNIDLDLNLLYKSHPDWSPKHPLSPSVDKIDDSGDYEINNIVICSRFANFGRNVYPFDKMPELLDKMFAGLYLKKMV